MGQLEREQLEIAESIRKYLRSIDMLYVWSALAGLVCALALIAIAQVWAGRMAG